jgi:hypothetical protein
VAVGVADGAVVAVAAAHVSVAFAVVVPWVRAKVKVPALVQVKVAAMVVSSSTVSVSAVTVQRPPTAAVPAVDGEKATVWALTFVVNAQLFQKPVPVPLKARLASAPVVSGAGASS